MKKAIWHSFINILHRAGVVRFDWTRFSKLRVLISILSDFQFPFDFSLIHGLTEGRAGEPIVGFH